MHTESILLLNREEDILRLFEEYLSVHEFKIYSCPSTKNALDILNDGSIPLDLIILDSNIGELSCFTIIKSLKKYEGPKILITVISEDKRFFKKVFKLGADDILTLPCTMKEFLECVESLI